MNGKGDDRSTSVTIPVATISLAGFLSMPEKARGLVIFAHGSGSGRFSPRNGAVARMLQMDGLATLLTDLLTHEEANDRRRVFDIPLLAERLQACTHWAAEESVTASLPVGYFGASTGAGAALLAAAQSPEWVHAVVSRGGRPDLAGTALPHVTAPTLLIVGGEDHAVIALNAQAYEELRQPKELAIVPGATHLFEEPGTLDRVADLACNWFRRYLPANTIARNGLA